VACLKENKQGFLTIKILQRFLKNCCNPPKAPEDSQLSSYKSLSDVIEYLEAKHHLLDTIFSNFNDYMHRVGIQVEKGEVDASDKLET